MKIKYLIFALMVLALSFKVDAIAVASDYLENNTLELVEGGSAIYSIRLQNPTDNEIGMKLDYDSTFMKVADYKDLYILQPRSNYKILFNVTAPKKPGLHSVSYTVSEVEPGGGAGVGLLLKINRNFNLKIIRDPSKFHMDNEVWYAAAAIILLIYFVRKERLEKRSRAKSKRFL